MNAKRWRGVIMTNVLTLSVLTATVLLIIAASLILLFEWTNIL